VFKYTNEAAFSKAVCAHLRKQGWFIQRIETGSTGRGVPDIYAIAPEGTAMWLELKRVHKTAKGRHYLDIPWRPGQQAWLYTVSKVYKQNAYTLCACDDCILKISHFKIYKNDCVILNECGKIPSIRAL
jgi:hypothetical protein